MWIMPSASVHLLVFGLVDVAGQTEGQQEADNREECDDQSGSANHGHIGSDVLHHFFIATL